MKKSFLICILLMPCFVALNAMQDQVLFCKKKDIISKFIEHIEKETKGIKILCSKMTHPKVIAALKEAKKRGVDVEILLQQKTKTSSPASLFSPCQVLYLDMTPVSGMQQFCIFGKEHPYIWIGNLTFPKNVHHKKQKEFAHLFDMQKSVESFLQIYQELKEKAI